MISYQDAAELLGLAAARDQRTVGRADVLAWQTDLSAARLDRAAAEAALTAYYQEMATREPRDRFRATPVDLIGIARRQRHQRLDGFCYQPPDGDETPAQYLARLRGQIAAVADGHTPPQRPALTAGSGAAIPDEVGEILRRVPAADRAASPLSVRCPTCSALVGRHCKGGRKGVRKGVRLAPHGSRRRAAHGTPADTPEDIEARRAASARYLANHQPEETA